MSAISTGEEIFLEISSSASALSFSDSDKGIESASGKINSPDLRVVLLHEENNRTIIRQIKNNLPFIRMMYYIIQKYKNSDNQFTKFYFKNLTFSKK